MKKAIEKLDDFGRGITYVNDKITFIPKCIPGDEVDFIITDEKSKYFLGELKSVITSSKDRTNTKCPYYSLCGGCSLQNLDYKKTLEFKKEKVINLFNKNKIDIKDISIVENPHPFNYRNKVSLKIINGLIGFYKENSHDIVPINKCVLVNESINKVIGILPLLGLKNANITIRSNNKEEILIVIDTKEKITNIPSVFNEIVNLKGIIYNNKTIYGSNIFIDEINDIKYEISYDSFFQVNPYITSLLYKEISNYIDSNDNVLDLYCGVGAISLMIAKKAKSVIGIEIIQNAVINAVKNKNLNNITNAEFILGDLSKGLKLDNKFNCVVLDPPRKGIDKKTMEWLLTNKPSKIIYISCDPNTLVRDIKILNDYNIKKIKLFDMFSYTYHCESICILERR